MPTKTIAYLRVSTEKQADKGVSLDAQRAKVRAYAELYDLELLEVIVDAGESAKSLDRPGLQRALELRTSQIEERLAEVAKAIAAVDRTAVDPEDVAKALAQFDPVWDALVPSEQANLLQLLIERVDYDGVAKEVAITFRADGISSLAGQERSAA